jgi:hypothetical protein
MAWSSSVRAAAGRDGLAGAGLSTRCSCSLVAGRPGPSFAAAWVVVDGPLARSGAGGNVGVETLRDEARDEAWLGSVVLRRWRSRAGRGATGPDRRDIEASTSMPRASAIGGQAATARAVHVGWALAMFAARLAARPRASMSQVKRVVRRPALESARTTAGRGGDRPVDAEREKPGGQLGFSGCAGECLHVGEGDHCGGGGHRGHAQDGSHPTGLAVRRLGHDGVPFLLEDAGGCAFWERSLRGGL